MVLSSEDMMAIQMVKLQILFQSGPNNEIDHELSTLVKDYFLSLPVSPMDFDRTFLVVVEEPAFRGLIGTQDNPDLHVTMELRRGRDNPFRWDILNILPFYAMRNMMQLEEGPLVVKVDDRVARAKEMFIKNNISVESVIHYGVGPENLTKLGIALSSPINAIAKSIIMISKKGELVYGLIPIARKINGKKLELACGLSKLKEVKTRDEILRYTGCEDCHVPPVAVLGKMPAIIDESLSNLPAIFTSAGFDRISFKFAPGQLIAAGFKVASLF